MPDIRTMKKIIANTDCVSLYRKLNPKSRATSDWTYYGSSGCVCRATCIYCRNVVSTCSAKWPKTKRFFVDANSHTKNCKLNWLNKLQVEI